MRGVNIDPNDMLRATGCDYVLAIPIATPPVAPRRSPDSQVSLRWRERDTAHKTPSKGRGRRRQLGLRIMRFGD